VPPGKQTILHVCSRDFIRELRDRILSLHGYQVISTLSMSEAKDFFIGSRFDLVLIDVEGDNRIPEAEKLCEEIRHKQPDQKIAFVCNYRVSHDSDCPTEIIHSEFNPAALVEGVREVLG
jgi:DNA-binding response OmpR family regulator